MNQTGQRARIFTPKGDYKTTLMNTTLLDAAAAAGEGGMVYYDDCYFRVSSGAPEPMDPYDAQDLGLYGKAVRAERAAAAQ